MKESFKKSLRITGKVFKWILILFVVLFVLIFVVWKVPAVHNYAVKRATSFFNEKTGGDLSIGHVDLQLPFFIGLENISLHSPDGSEVASINDLSVYPGWRMLFAKTIRIDEISLSGTEGKIFVNQNGEFNFDFIVAGFSDSTAVETDPVDTTSSGWEFSLGDLTIEKLNFIYSDRTTGDSIDIKIDSFELDMDLLDLENQAYLAESISLNNSEIFAQISASENTTEQSSTALPVIGLEELEIENTIIQLKLGSEPAYKFELGEVYLQTDEIDLNQNRFVVDEFLLSDSKFQIPLPAADSTQVTDDIQPNPTSSFFPDVDVKVDEFELENISLRAFDNSDTLHAISNLSLSLEQIEIDSMGYAFDLESVEGKYNEFGELPDLQGEFAFQNVMAKAHEVGFRYGESSINLDAEIEYDTASKFLESFKINFLDFELEESQIATADLKKIFQFLKIDSIPLPAQDIFLSGDAEGDENSIDLSRLKVKTGNSLLEIQGSASAMNDSLWPSDLKLKNLKLNLNKTDLLPFTEFMGIDTTMIPSSFSLGLKGLYTSVAAEAAGFITTPFGEIALEVEGDGWSSKKQGIGIILNSEALNLGEYLKLSDELKTDFLVKLETENLADSTLTLCAELDIDTLNYSGALYSNLDLDAELIDTDVLYAFSIADTFVNAEIGGTVDFSSGINAIVNGKVNGIDLEGLNMAAKDIRGSFDINARFRQDSISTDSYSSINEILFVKNGERFPLEPLEASFYSGPDSTSAMVQSSFMQLNSVANRRVDSLRMALADFIARGENETISDSEAYWIATFEASDLNEVGQLFLPELKEFKPSTAEITFSAQENEFNATAVFPGIKYAAFSLDSLYITTTKKGMITERRLHIDKVTYDTLALSDIDLKIDRTASGAKTLLTINPDTSDNYYRIGADLKPDSIALVNGYTFHFNDTMILNGKQWMYENECSLKSDGSNFSFQDFRIFRDQKFIELEKAESDSPLKVTAENFPLHTLTGIISTEEKLFNGIINGEVTLNNDGSFEGNGNIGQFEISGADFGALSWQASKENNNFKTLINTKGELVDIVIEGDIMPQNDSVSTLDLALDVNRFDLNLLEKLVANNVTEASGTLSGQISIEGTTALPQLNGVLKFDNAQMRPNGIRSAYTLDNDQIKITPDGLSFDRFTLSDANGSELSVNGTITHDKFVNPQLDLTIKSGDFLLLDIEKAAGNYIYGQLVADLDLKVTGPPTSPEVDAKVKINEPTDFSYIVTSSADVEAFDESLLVWTNFEENPDDAIITRNKQEQDLAGNIFARNPKINGELIIDKSAIFQVIVDSSAGDYLQIQGSGKLDIDYDRTGALRFNGVYEVANGFYQMTFYDIQKKKFEFLKGSKLVWNGEPTNANIDISASYSTRAGISSLMLTDPSASYDEAFQQQLPFLVFLNVDGKLLEPQISFDIKLADEAEGALSGSVEARLNEIRENENRLNKQVFALLVLGSFLPQDGGSDSNVLVNQARNSASQILTNQLNSLSDKYVKGVDINFDMYSYGGTAGQGTTDLSVNLAKSFADDRIIVKVGSTVAIEDGNSGSAQSSQQQFMTNIEVEYKLTPDGRYRLLVFSKTDLEDIVIGRITRSGGGFVFQKDFDRFRYIFNEPEDKATDTVEESESEKE